MRDFTFKTFKLYLTAIKKSYPQIIRFDEYFKLNPKPESFCLLRHDVDRKPLNALKMAKVENSMGVAATYCFRTKRHTFKPDIISEISKMGHEIAYHYESLSDAKGDMVKAVEDFEKNLAMLRKYVTVSTVSMHGSPLKSYDNRDIWRIAENHEKFIHTYKLLGELYLDIDYNDIAYINDTGRNWTAAKSNRRDRVNSKIETDFKNGKTLLNYLNNQPHPKLVFLCHPERWSDNLFEYVVQFSKDMLINLLKTAV